MKVWIRWFAWDWLQEGWWDVFITDWCINECWNEMEFNYFEVEGSDGVKVAMVVG